MSTKNQAIEKINNEIEKLKYQKYSNEWNVANQLIDILAVSSDETSEIVLQDFEKAEMTLDKAVSKVVSKRLADPEKVMAELCRFYGILVPPELPPEHWRQGKAKASADVPKINILDLF